MKARTFAPRKLDIGAFIESGEVLSGALPVAGLQRVTEGLSKEVDVATLPEVCWSAQGRQVAQRVGGPQLWLDLDVKAELAWECQRCLHPVQEPVSVQRSIRFVKDEAAAAELDAESDDDVLALSRQFDLMALIEDELVMAQPIVPRHEQCPVDVGVMRHDDTEVTPGPGAQNPASHPANSTPESDAEQDVSLTTSGRPNPFAVLAALKKDKT